MARRSPVRSSPPAGSPAVSPTQLSASRGPVDGLAATTPTAPRGGSFRRYAGLYLLASLAITAVWGSVGGILLPNHVQVLELSRYFTGADAGTDLTALTALRNAVDAGTTTATPEQQRLLQVLSRFEASRAEALSIVTAVGVFATMLVQPIVGVLSDRTRSRHGRRAPWLFFGAVVGSLFLAAVRFAPSIALLALLWTLAQVVLNFITGPLTATVADRVDERRLGAVSAVGGMGTMLGGVLGAVIVGAAFERIGLDAYFLIAALVLVGVLAFVLGARDRSSLDQPASALRWGPVLRGFLVPLRDSDFRWVWIARVLLTFGYAVSTTFSLYMLQSYIEPAMSAARATSFAPVLIGVGLPATVVGILLAGRLSDRTGRRKPFVIASSLLMATAMLIPFLSPTLPALIAQAVLGGFAFGVYLPVDQALFIGVLPDKDAAGRDLGIAAVASNLGQALGPVLAGQVVAITGGYRVVWLLALVLVLVAAVAVVPVKKVR